MSYQRALHILVTSDSALAYFRRPVNIKYYIPPDIELPETKQEKKSKKKVEEDKKWELQEGRPNTYYIIMSSNPGEQLMRNFNKMADKYGAKNRYGVLKISPDGNTVQLCGLITFINKDAPRKEEIQRFNIINGEQRSVTTRDLIIRKEEFNDKRDKYMMMDIRLVTGQLFEFEDRRDWYRKKNTASLPLLHPPKR